MSNGMSEIPFHSTHFEHAGPASDHQGRAMQLMPEIFQTQTHASLAPGWEKLILRIIWARDLAYDWSASEDPNFGILVL